MKLLAALGLGLWAGWIAADRRYSQTLTVRVGDGETIYRARRIADTWDPIPKRDIPVIPIR